MASSSRMLIVQVAALGGDLINQYPELFEQLSLEFKPLVSPFPAVTSTAQATFRTGRDTGGHGIVGNGLFDRLRCRVDFWNQSSRLICLPRIWQRWRQAGRTVGMLFWQQSLGEAVDLILSPAPVHKHGGGMIQDCYSQPSDLYGTLCRQVGRSFNLFHYWGPLASIRSSRWIAEATAALLRNPQLAPDLLLTYLPHLDYVLQQHGPLDTRRVSKACGELVAELRKILDAARAAGYEVVIWGDYAVTPASQVVWPNRILSRAGFMHTRMIRKMLYPDLYRSRAWAMVDHQVAHVYVADGADVQRVLQLLRQHEGVAEARMREPTEHPNCGEIIITAAAGAWFAYPWWEDDCQAPDYAAHVDIHNKIGFDPCELFWGKLLPPGVSLDPTRVKGTHGRAEAAAAVASTVDLPGPIGTLQELSQALGGWLDTHA